MVELSDPKGPVKEGIDNSIFIIPGIIIALLIGMYSNVKSVNRWEHFTLHVHDMSNLQMCQHWQQ